MSDDYSSSTETVGAVAVGSSATGDLETGGDRDWFAVTLRAGFSYRFDLEGSPTSGGTLSDPYLRGIYDASGNFINGTTSDDHGTGLNSLVTFTAAEDGVYYVSAGAFASRQGTYTLSVTELTPADDNRAARSNADDYTAGIDTIGTVAVDGLATGDLETGGDRDWFAVTLDAGSSYQFDLEGSRTAGGTLSDPYLRGIHDASGNIINGTTNDDAGAGYNSRVSFTATVDGVHYVSAGAFASGQGTYTLSVTELAPAGADESTADLTAGTDTTGTVPVGGSVTGEIDFDDDYDWFAVTLQANRIYQFDLTDAETGGADADPFLAGIHDASGNLIDGTLNSDYNLYDTVLTFTATADGIHYVALGAFTAFSGAFTYQLAASDITDSVTDDFAAGTGTVGAVAVGGSVTGEIEINGDRDWFAITLQEDRIYQFDLMGSDTADGTLVDPYLRGIYDAAGARISGTTNNDGGSFYNSQVTFTATADAIYYVSAGANTALQGAYTLSVADVTDGIEDDFKGGTDTAGTVAVDGSATGELESVGDRDWFAVTLQAGKIYQIDLAGSSGSGALSDPYLYGIHDAAGALFEGSENDDYGDGNNARLLFSATEAGVYYISAGSHEVLFDGASSLDGYVGAYTLSVADVTTRVGDDYTAAIGTAGTVAVDGSATGEIESFGDRDWFAVTLREGRTYIFDLEGLHTNRGSLSNPYLAGIHDAAGALIDGTTNENDGIGLNSRVSFTATADGIHYVSAGSGSSVGGAYTLSVADVSDDFASDATTAGDVEVGGFATGEINSDGDRDWFAVTLEQGKTYQFDLAGSSTGAGTLVDPYLRGIHDAAGNLIRNTADYDSGPGLNSRETFTATADGVYYVSAGAHEDYQGTYRLSVTDTTDDFTAGIDTAGAVAVGGSATGVIERDGDRDWFALPLEQGKTYQFDLSGGSATGGQALADPYLRGIHDAAGNLIAGTANDDYGTGRNSRVTFTATADGAYYVSAGAYRTNQGAYTLSVTDITDDFTAGIDTAGTVEVGGSATGAIETHGDRDWFAVTLQAGNIYDFDLKGSGTAHGTLSDPYLYGIHDAAGNLIAGTTDDNGASSANYNSRVTFTATETATYYVSAGAFEPLRGSGHTGSYTLSVTAATAGVSDDDYTAAIDTVGAVEVGGSASGRISDGSDLDWFAVTLEQGKTYWFDLEGAATGDNILRDPYLRGIHDALGNLIAGTTDNDGGDGNNSRLTFTATADAIYYVSAGANQPYIGRYTLSVTEATAEPEEVEEVEEVEPEDFTAGTDTIGTVEVGGSVISELETAGDRDWFALTLEQGKTYRFDLEGSATGGGTLRDPFLRGIHDAQGNLISGTANDDFGGLLNSRVTFTATGDGVYYVSAAGYRSHVGDYTLSVEEVI